MPKVLVVSYFFPPAGNVGVHRTLRFLKWLPEFGWQPVVLTPRNAKVPNLESSLLEKISPDLPIVRTSSFEALNYGTSLAGGRPRHLPGVLQKLCIELPRDAWKYLSVPDEKLGWVPFATRVGRRVIAEHGISAIYVTGKPFSSYFIGDALARRTGIPWIMDLRDLWTLNQRLHPTTVLHGRVESRLESRFVHSAAAVIANTPGNRDDFIVNFPDCRPEKFVTITNGFDADDFEHLPRDKYDKFTIGYSGTFYFADDRPPGLYRRLLGFDRKRSELYDTYSPKFLFRALVELFAETPGMRARTEIVFTGPGCEKIRALVDEFGLADNVKLCGWIEYRESLAMLSRSHLLVLALSRGSESAGWIPSKLYQYLGAGSPILALVPPGDVADIVRDTNSGQAVEPDNVPAIKSALRAAFAEFAAGSSSFAPDAAAVARYEGRQLTEQLAGCLDRITGRRVPAPAAVVQTSS
jgi:glycosyltransferase involved in cell wall biosynthesis